MSETPSPTFTGTVLTAELIAKEFKFLWDNAVQGKQLTLQEILKRDEQFKNPPLFK